MHMTLSKLKVSRQMPFEVGWNAEDLAPLMDITEDSRKAKPMHAGGSESIPSQCRVHLSSHSAALVVAALPIPLVVGMTRAGV